MSFTALTISEASRLIASRELSPVELTRLCIERARQSDACVNAFVLLMEEQALWEAAQAEAEILSGRYRGALHGIPLGLKDIIDVESVATTACSLLLKDNIARQDAAVTSKLRSCGAIILGKVTTHEFALGGPSFDLPWPPARNPWNPEHFTGGSSSGSAVATATGMILAGLGTDTAGSIRFPAAYCGIAGFKPTFGLVSRRGIVPLAETLDTVGPMAWTVEDCAIIMQCIAGYDSGDHGSVQVDALNYTSTDCRDLKGLKIGVVRHHFDEDTPVASNVAHAMNDAISIIAGLGASIREVRLDPLSDYSSCMLAIMLMEGFAAHRTSLVGSPEKLGSIFLERMALGAVFTAADYIEAQRKRRLLKRRLLDSLQGFDAVVTAITGSEAPSISSVSPYASYDKPLFSAPFSVAGMPALSLCCGFSEAGLPLAIQIAGKPFDDPVVLRIGRAFEAATSWRDRRPKIFFPYPEC
ncbi:aspartyl-tRNA(Asn)/glutamyl-tRNA(Gln) amidotransferase subunit A [Aminobacter aminovorans]|uniref:Indoleacetamide hydrolase n=1 Tax=Aminobacter aminovorans TaxID=83263 RepID=A0A381IM05_AMIAI|nr:amidase [Aminobacter aminovorans]TCS25073.1 aspartyl-tRNA(Asn)/glutamyl-tRNA(Gln) amidotransferase subunit A [Aminobacter aminovorans]SUY28424.1 Glutamyl-tRNA(Gln) amidotransferase subunit A [Aminobacter aminovorans]